LRPSSNACVAVAAAVTASWRPASLTGRKELPDLRPRKVKMIGESATDEVECSATRPTAAPIWFGSGLELCRPS